MSDKQEFIKSIAQYVIKYAPQYNIRVHSPIIAQAIIESNFGESELAKNAQNYFGLKYSQEHKDRCPTSIGYYAKEGSEQLVNGSYVSNMMFWQKFSNMEDGVRGYFDFLNYSSRYNNIKGITDPKTYLEIIKSDGYATSLDYVTTVMNIVKAYNLTQYDNNAVISVPKEISIQQVCSTHNTTALDRMPQYIVLHYTAGLSSKKGSAKNVANYFATTNKEASADFIVDDVDIVQYNADPKKRYCWSVGGNKYTTLSTSLGAQYYGIVTNKNSISIEMCSNKSNNTTLNATDTDWYITDETLVNAILLTRYLMKVYNIPKQNVIMHHQVNGKICPNPFCVNENALKKWNEFLTQLDGVKPNIQPQPTKPTQQENVGTDKPKKYNFMLNGLNYNELFDPTYYVNKYADLMHTFGNNPYRLWEHFIKFGLNELRQCSDKFNVVVYMENNPDLKAYYGKNYLGYYEHYLTYGKNENRKCK